MHEPRPAAGGSALEHPPAGSRLAFYQERIKAEADQQRLPWELDQALFTSRLVARLAEVGIVEPFPPVIVELIWAHGYVLQDHLTSLYLQGRIMEAEDKRRGPSLHIRQILMGVYHDACTAAPHVTHFGVCEAVSKRLGPGISRHAVHRAMMSMPAAFFDAERREIHKGFGETFASAASRRLARWDAGRCADGTAKKAAGTAQPIRSRSATSR